jgi:predicted porin
MRTLGAILLASVAGLAVASGAQAADLPTTKAPTAPPPPSCYASFYSWLDSTAAECPLSYMGITFYGQIDVGFGYQTGATQFNGSFPNGVQELVSKTSNGAQWQWVPNGLSQSNVGIKLKEQVIPNWFIVGDANFGFDPYSLEAANGPKSLVDNNFYPSTNQNLISANGDSSRAGQWDNSRAYIGVSNPTFGTLTFGRQYALTNELASAYDPFGGAYAFSLIGTSSTVVAGTGETETARYNTSFEYKVAYNGFRAAAIAQVGGWDQGNGANGAYQIDLGADYAGFSIDAIYAYAMDAVKLGTTGGVPAAPLAPDTLVATLADVNAGVVGVKYKWQGLTLYGGYEYAQLSSPSNLTPAGSANGIPIGNVYTLNGGYPAVIHSNAFVNPDDLQVLWIGAKYAILSNLDAAIGYYHEWQNDYDTSPATDCIPNTTAAAPGATPQGTAKSDCAGTTDVVSGMLDWRPVKRVDVYGGVMYSAVSGGMATGFIKSDNTAFTAGLRVSF